MSTAYRHTQVGYLNLMMLDTICVLEVVVWFLLPAEQQAEATSICVSIFVFIVTLGLLFYRLTVELHEGTIRLQFGIGLIQKTIRQHEIRSIRVVRNKWYYGWGIRLTPHGWLWNIQGLGAVELEYLTGKKFRIGSDEPAVLCAAVQSGLGIRPATN